MRAAALVLVLLLAALLAGCKTNMQAACSGHGGVRGYVSGQVRCNDGTWQ